MGNIEFFNELADRSSNLMNTGRSISLRFKLYRNIFRDIDAKIKISQDDVVMDLGGGCGQISAYIAKKCKKVVLVDGAFSAIELAKKKLAKFNNVDYFICDLNQLPLPDFGMKFDKIICYSVIQYLDDYDKFGALLANLMELLQPRGKILFGDIPLPDKLASYLENRKKYPIKNFFLNQKYYFRRFVTSQIFRIKAINAGQIIGLNWSKEKLSGYLANCPHIEFKFINQNKKLIFCNSSEDLLIVKK